MSWDSYRDSLTQTGLVDKAAVCGIDDGGVWTRSPDFNIGPNEIKSIINAFRNPESVRSAGILIGGVKYLYLQSDDSQIQGKKGSAGISIARSNKCIIIGTYRDGQQPGNCRLQVERIRDYLLQSSY
jgi:profilin